MYNDDISLIIDNLKELFSKYKSVHIQPEHFILAILENEKCKIYKIINDNLITDNIKELSNWCIERLNKLTSYDKGYIFDEKLNYFFENYTIDPKKTTVDALINLLEHDNQIIKKFKQYGLGIKQLNNYADNVPSKTKKINESNKTTKKTTKNEIFNTNLDNLLKNLSNLSNIGKIDEVYNNDDIIKDIFYILGKKEKNNVVLVGDDGIGKTSTIKHIANLIRDGEVPNEMLDKKLYAMDFMSLVESTSLRGGFETKFNLIVDTANLIGNCIFFIDDIQSILNSNSKFTEVSTDVMLDSILSNNNISFICTATPKDYSKYIATSPILNSRLEKITMNEKSEDEIIDIVSKKICNYENFHGVKYDKEAIECSVKLCKRYITNQKMPNSVLNLLDEVGSYVKQNKKENPKLIELRDKMYNVINEREKLIEYSMNKESDKIDELTKLEIEYKSEYNKLLKDEKLNNKKIKVQENSVREILSKKIKMPIDDLNKNEIEKLKNIDSKIKESVIGQDEAVDEVCRAIKRQRVGLSNPNKPVSLLLVGSTGVGKTFIAKKLSETMFGSENNMVRIDMSEYSDSTSLNKLIGAGQGYIGYDDGGVLTEAIKKKPYCVLLLDEIEKANTKIFDMFLQVFDDGRLSDNKGQLVDFRNVIILMTSNIGIKEVSNSTSAIGFMHHDENDIRKETIDKTIKKFFRPEFINRIDKIVHFNNLNDNDLIKIIKLEIKKIEKRVEDIGYHIDKDISSGEFIDLIFNEVSKNKEYGARPIIRELQFKLVDKLTDFIIFNSPKKGYTFKLKDIYN